MDGALAVIDEALSSCLSVALPEFVPPSYLDEERKPLRNRYHRRS